jgi:long-chain acyl-CoA synthetase
MSFQFFYDVFLENIEKTAVIFKDSEISYGQLMQKIEYWKSEISKQEILPGEVIALSGDFTPMSISAIFALLENNNIIMPLDSRHNLLNERKMEIGGVSKHILINEFDEISFYVTDYIFNHPYYELLQKLNHPGLVLFTSGTSGVPKAAVHDFLKLLEKFRQRRKSLKTLNFLLFDHWGGLNTMLHTLSNGGTVMALNNRQPHAICHFIEKYKIELLPASPTFLNLLLVSEEYKNFDLSSLKLITYGTEPMAQSTLSRLKEAFPDVKLQQTYGLIELGVLRSKSKSDDSLWIKVGGEGYDLRVVDGLLEIKADSAMLGYLNAPSPFTDDGWFMTGDQVEVDGDYLKILGRKSEIINVGGEKVYPAEVESVIQELSNVAEVTVFGEKNPLMGNIVCAKVRLISDEDNKSFTLRLKKYCKLHLQSFKIPVKVTINNEFQFGDRYKKKRNF